MVKKDFLEILIGVILIIFSYVLAIPYKSRFYAILLLGMFFVLNALYRLINKKEFLNPKLFIEIYLAFLLMGIVMDSIFGIWITKLWFYPGYTLFNYFILYAITYPLFGYVMTCSFSLLESVFVLRLRKNRLAYREARILSKIFIVLGIMGMLASIFLINYYKGFFIFLFFVILVCSLISYFTLKIKKDNLPERFLLRPVKYAILILIVAYTQGFIHEFPNIFVREWIYQNFLFEKVLFFGVPVTVLFIGWIALVVLPYLLLELILALNKLKNPLSFKLKRKRW